MSQGICFYSQYNYPLPLLAICLHSLERNYSGDIHLVMGDQTPKWFVELAKKNKRISTSMTSVMNKIEGERVSQDCWNTKPLIHRLLPFDINILYDCDSVFVNRFDMSVFEVIKDRKLASFNHKKQELPLKSNSLAAHRTKSINLALGEKIDFLPSINGGCVGSSKRTSAALINEWVENINRIISSRNKYLQRVPDEYGLSLTMVKHGIPVDGRKWSYVPILKNQKDVEIEFNSIISLHFAHRKYLYSRHYYDALKMALNDDYMGLASLSGNYKASNKPFSKSLNKIVK